MSTRDDPYGLQKAAAEEPTVPRPVCSTPRQKQATSSRPNEALWLHVPTGTTRAGSANERPAADPDNWKVIATAKPGFEFTELTGGGHRERPIKR